MTGEATNAAKHLANRRGSGVPSALTEEDLTQEEKVDIFFVFGL